MARFHQDALPRFLWLVFIYVGINDLRMHMYLQHSDSWPQAFHLAQVSFQSVKVAFDSNKQCKVGEEYPIFWLLITHLFVVRFGWNLDENSESLVFEFWALKVDIYQCLTPNNLLTDSPIFLKNIINCKYGPKVSLGTIFNPIGEGHLLSFSISLFIRRRLQMNELSLPLLFSFSLGNADIFPFSKHSIKCCLIFDTSYIILGLKESGEKQNSTTFAIAKSPQS